MLFRSIDDLGAVFYVAEYIACIGGCGLDNVCGNRLYVGIPDWGCICVPQVFRLRPNRGMDCHDDRLGIPWALLLPALLWEQMGKSLAIVIWAVKGLSVWQYCLA